MSSADLATVVITCPNCGTHYQVPYGTLGADGRDVQCAQCTKSWHAEADAPPPPPPVPARRTPLDPDALFSADDEAALDAAFEHAAPPPPPLPATQSISADHARTLAEIRAAVAPKQKPKPVNEIDPAQLSKAKQSFNARVKQVNKTLPMARFRRATRWGSMATLATVLVVSIVLRGPLVGWFPALAGLYAAIGLPVNVVGLEISEAKTVTSLRDGKIIMQVNAKIRSVAGQTVQVPPVLVSLLNTAGQTIYEWTVTPDASEIEPGEAFSLSTEVNSPPDGATRVRLSFTTLRGATALPAAKAS